SSKPDVSRRVKSSSWYSAGSRDEMGWRVSRPGTARRPRLASCSPAVLARSGTLHLHLVVVREDQAVGIDLEPLHRLAAVPGDRIGGQKPGILDKLRSREALEHGIDLADVERPPEGPSVAGGASGDRAEVAVQR